MSASAAASTTSRVRTHASRSAVASAAPTASSSASISYGTAPPTTNVLTTTGAGQSLTNAPQTAVATDGNPQQSQGVWAATAGLDQSGSTSAGTSLAAVKTGWDHMSTGAKAGIIAAIAGGLAVLIGLIGFCCIRKRRRSEQAAFSKRTQPLRNSFISSPQPFAEDKEKYGSSNPLSQSPAQNQYFSPQDAYYPPQQNQGQPGQRRDYAAYARDSVYSQRPAQHASYGSNQIRPVSVQQQQSVYDQSGLADALNNGQQSAGYQRSNLNNVGRYY